MEKYLIKFAWKCNHEIYGPIISFVATPYHETSPHSWGYSMTDKKDEVFRFPSGSEEAQAILRRLAPIGGNQWGHPSYGDLIEEEFDFDCFTDDAFYQENYGRPVIFHTHDSCM